MFALERMLFPGVQATTIFRFPSSDSTAVIAASIPSSMSPPCFSAKTLSR